jgi:hypothetical protein
MVSASQPILIDGAWNAAFRPWRKRKRGRADVQGSRLEGERNACHVERAVIDPERVLIRSRQRQCRLPRTPVLQRTGARVGSRELTAGSSHDNRADGHAGQRCPAREDCANIQLHGLLHGYQLGRRIAPHTSRHHVYDEEGVEVPRPRAIVCARSRRNARSLPFEGSMAGLDSPDLAVSGAGLAGALAPHNTAECAAHDGAADRAAR